MMNGDLWTGIISPQHSEQLWSQTLATLGQEYPTTGSGGSEGRHAHITAVAATPSSTASANTAERCAPPHTCDASPMRSGGPSSTRSEFPFSISGGFHINIPPCDIGGPPSIVYMERVGQLPDGRPVFAPAPARRGGAAADSTTSSSLKRSAVSTVSAPNGQATERRSSSAALPSSALTPTPSAPTPSAPYVFVRVGVEPTTTSAIGLAALTSMPLSQRPRNTPREAVLTTPHEDYNLAGEGATARVSNSIVGGRPPALQQQQEQDNKPLRRSARKQHAEASVSSEPPTPTSTTSSSARRTTSGKVGGLVQSPSTVRIGLHTPVVKVGARTTPLSSCSNLSIAVGGVRIGGGGIVASTTPSERTEAATVIVSSATPMLGTSP